jgi:HMG (high mobility group) box
MCFRSYFLAEQRRMGSTQSQNEISKQAGRTWNELSEEWKHPFVVLAEKEKKEHQAKYPDYVYTPASGNRTGRPKQKVHAGGITKKRSKQQPRIQFDSEELESPPSSPYPTRLSPESERGSPMREESQPESPVVESLQPVLVPNESESSPHNIGCGFVSTEDIPSAHMFEKVRVFAT